MGLGLKIVEALVKWVEGLDPKLLSAVAGITLMNEPAHLNAIEEEIADSNDQILQWLADAADIFRKSTLSQNGVKLYMNIIETAFKPPGFDKLIPTWWHQTFNS